VSYILYNNIIQQLTSISEPILLIGQTEKNLFLTSVLQQPYLCVLFDLKMLHDLVKIQQNTYKVVIFDNILSKLDYLHVLDLAKQLLTAGGHLYIIDNISQNLPTAQSQATPHIATYLIAQAQRSGFELIDNCVQNQLTLLQFKQQYSTRWRILPVTEQQKSDVQTLFKHVFNADMSDAMWQWKYGQQRGVAIGIYQQNEIVAHYGGMQRRLHYFAESRIGIQIGDVMVLPSERGRLTKHGAFFLSASTFAERHVGYATAHFLPYGFPNARHLKVAEKLDIYAKVDDVVDIVWDTAAVARQSTWQYVQVVDKPLVLQSVVNKLWRKMSRELAEQIALIRDWDYMQYRYLQRPDKKYTFLVIYNIFLQPVGLVVIAIELDCCRFMDYLGSLRHIPRVMHQICNYLQQQDIEQLSGWFSAAIAEHFAQSGGQVSATEIVLPTIIWGQGVDVEQIKQKWWLTTGDSDFL
jgi:hypothetical protein